MSPTILRPSYLAPHRQQHAYLSYSSKKPNRRKRILNGFSKAFQRQAYYFVKKLEKNAKNTIFTPFKPAYPQGLSGFRLLILISQRECVPFLPIFVKKSENKLVKIKVLFEFLAQTKINIYLCLR